MGSRDEVRRFNAPKGWRLLRAVLIWAGGALLFGFATSYSQPDLPSRAARTLLGGGIWGLFMLPWWLGDRVQVIVSRDWIEGRKWLRILFYRDGLRHPFEPGETLVRRANGHVVLTRSAGVPLRIRLLSADWAGLSAAVGAAGVAVVDERVAWEAANPGLHRLEWLLTLAAVALCAAALISLPYWHDAAGFLLGVAALALAGLCTLWRLNLPGLKGGQELRG